MTTNDARTVRKARAAFRRLRKMNRKRRVDFLASLPPEIRYAVAKLAAGGQP